ncbi:MAG: methyltransferase domain-containing protein [Candidatus Hydrogenedentes bacterium]|nr:methyltransferase domain-containing protein [Candidatus Hydrogenedentota bacterium]
MKQDSRYWDAIAPQWTTEIFNSLQSDRNRIILTELKRAAKTAHSIADYGCGVGTYLPTLARLFDEVQGFDHSEVCVQLAQKRMRRKRNVSVRQSAAAPRAYRGRFDAALCVNVAINPNRRAWRCVLQSAASLLKPEGRLIVVVPSVESGVMVAKAEGPESRPTSAGTVLMDGVPTKHYSRAELHDALTGIGMHVSRIRRVEYSWRSQSVTPPAELRHTLPWDWIAIARNTASNANEVAA